MKAVGAILRLSFFALLLVEVGCEPGPPGEPPVTGNGSNPLFVYASYRSEKIDIMPLTDFVSTGAAEDVSQIKVYVSLLDLFDCQIKSPGIFRFELYDHEQRSPEPKGRRIVIWPDIDLTDVAENNNYWQDYLRVYEFTLDFEPQSSHSYVLQVTCFCPNGKRLSDNIVLKCTK